MSRNFELLRRAGWRQDYFEGLPGASAPAPEPARREPFSRRTRNLPPANDPIANIVRKVFLEPRTSPARIVTFIGISRRAGCTWTCVHAAKTLAKCVDGKICLVDVNFESPGISRYFSSGTSSGISDSLLEAKPAKNYAVRAGEGNVWYLPAGSQCQRAQMLSEGRQIESHLKSIAKEFDYVLIDTPALSSSPLVTATCRASDGAVLVIEPSGVSTAALARGRSVLAAARVQLFGVVLNQRVPTLPTVLDRLMR
jgi:Mrp family chromosome partitioning ATPase